jgi:hypothetical protein
MILEYITHVLNRLEISLETRMPVRNRLGEQLEIVVADLVENLNCLPVRKQWKIVSTLREYEQNRNMMLRCLRYLAVPLVSVRL